MLDILWLDAATDKCYGRGHTKASWRAVLLAPRLWPYLPEIFTKGQAVIPVRDESVMLVKLDNRNN